MSKLLLNALRAKIGGQSVSGGSPASHDDGQTGTNGDGAGSGDFHLVSVGPGTEPSVSVPAAVEASVSISTPALAPFRDAPTVSPAEPTLVPVEHHPSSIGERGQEDTEKSTVLHFTPVLTGTDIPIAAVSPVHPPVPKEQSTFPVLQEGKVGGLSTEPLLFELERLKGQKRRLNFKRAIPRLATFAVIVLSAFSFTSLPKHPSLQGANLAGSVPALTTVPRGNSIQIPPARFFVELTKECPNMTRESRAKLQSQLQEEASESVTVNDAIAYLVFACGYDVEAGMDGFGSWAVTWGVVDDPRSANKPLTRDSMHKLLSIPLASTQS